jgi:hypothetical protein
MQRPAAPDLSARLADVTLHDEHRLRRRIDRARRDRDPQAYVRVAEEVERAEARLARRRASVPAVSYPPELPVSARREDLLARSPSTRSSSSRGRPARARRPSCRSCASSSGAGIRGTIAHTQPRRLAARTVAQRIADELRVPLGEAVGYSVRFASQAREETLLRLMTDGLLLAEIQQDRDLRRYDTIIIDEAHERSLNIDFLLGYLHGLLPRRPDLKLLITSATIDPGQFARHFGDAPVVEVSGRTYPVEVRYRAQSRPRDDDEDDGEAEDAGRRGLADDPVEAIGDAVDELCTRGPTATSSSSSPASARSATRPTTWRPARARGRDPAALRAPVHARAAAGLPGPPRPARRAGHERRRDRRSPCPGSATSSTRAPRGSRATRAAEGPAPADRADLAGVRRPAQGPLRAHRERHLRPAVSRGRLPGPARASPTRRSCARASPR